VKNILKISETKKTIKQTIIDYIVIVIGAFIFSFIEIMPEVCYNDSVICKKEGKAMSEYGEKVRVCKHCGETL